MGIVPRKDSFGINTIGNDLNQMINSLSIYNYQVGRALVESEKYNEAIPFLEKSIKDAKTEEDLVGKKDATRKLSEVYDNVGNYDKAYSTYRDYVSLLLQQDDEQKTDECSVAHSI